MTHPRQKNFLRGPGDVPPDFGDMCLTLAAVMAFVLLWVALP